MNLNDRLGRDSIDELLRHLQDHRAPADPRDEGLRDLLELDLADDCGDTHSDRVGSTLEPAVLETIRLTVRLELGRRLLTIEEAMQLRAGDIVELGAADAPVVLLVGETPIARGELLVVDDRFCVRLTEILSRPAARGSESAATEVAL